MTYTATHWGVYRHQVRDGRLVGMAPAEWDRDPSPIGSSMPDGITAPCRVRRPAVREGFLKGGAADRESRGRDRFVEVPWDEALDLVARELERVRGAHGNEAIFGGSYGWASAGRFHHAQSHVHRFLNTIGGYVSHVDTYSLGAGRVLLPHVLGSMDEVQVRHTAWSVLAEHCELFVSFGGLPTRNTQVSSGGATSHVAREGIAQLREAGVRFINISPVRHDLDEVPDAEWIPIRPGSDTALMLGLAYEVVVRGLHYRVFLDRYTSGYRRFEDYLLGRTDGQPKDARWAAALTGIEAATIADLAVRMASRRTMVNVAWALQRAMSGEQPFWMGITLAAILGQIGTTGGGIGLGYGSMNMIGGGGQPFSGLRVPQGTNPVKAFIPVARIADMLLNPGTAFDYNGRRLVYPDIRLVYWAGGNAFHHHQDLNRLARAWRRPETMIVHEPFWTAQARFADIVLPATTPLERNDISSAAGEFYMIANKRAVAPLAEARDDYTIFAALADRLGVRAAYTEGRSADEWLVHLYEATRERADRAGITLPDFTVFWEKGAIKLPLPAEPPVLLAGFRADPAANPLRTPSGRIEIFSERIAGFGYADCPGHPTWLPPAEWLGADLAARYPFHLLSSQPRTRLHGQYDHGCVSQAAKVQGREPILLNTQDASRRGIANGDVVRVSNARGAFIAGAVLSDGIRSGVAQIATGAWYDPADPSTDGSLDKHGNPNAVTADVPASALSQGCAAQSVLVDISRYDGPLPDVTAFRPPV